MKTIIQTVHISAKPQDVYEAYTNARKHAEFTGGKTKFENKVGGKFDIWGGELTGENMELVKGKKIIQKWRASDWPEGHFSDFTINLESGNDGTRLVLVQENVPDDKADDIDDGWHQYYWKPMNEYFKRNK